MDEGKAEDEGRQRMEASRSALLCCITEVLACWDSLSDGAKQQADVLAESCEQERELLLLPAAFLLLLERNKHSQGLHAAWHRCFPMGTKRRGSASLPAGSPELQSKHPALAKAHSSLL